MASLKLSDSPVENGVREGKHLVVLEEMPNIAKMDIDKDLQEKLRGSFEEFLYRGMGSTVLIASTGSHLGDDFMFMEKLSAHPRVQVIKMNPVANTIVKKALQRVADREGLGKSVTSKELTVLAESSDGDLRAAVNALQLHATNRLNGNADDDTPLVHHDRAMGLLHATGKLLHPKRQIVDPHFPGQPPPLEFNVEDVVAGAQAKPSTVMDMLHESYIGNLNLNQIWLSLTLA